MAFALLLTVTYRRDTFERDFFIFNTDPVLFINMEREDCMPPEITYGPLGDGTYITPYRVTVFYHSDSVFETAIAALSARSQIIPIADHIADYSKAVELYEHPTAEILIFGAAFTREDILKFFDRYADTVRIFVYNDMQKRQYYNENTADQNTTTFHPRVVCFGIDELYKHVLLSVSPAVIYLLEYLSCATFPQYKSITNDPDITAATGRDLIRGLELENSGHSGLSTLCTNIISLCEGIDSFDKIAQMIASGRTIQKMHEARANEYLERGFLCNNELCRARFWITQGAEIIPTMVQLASVHPAVVRSCADVVLIYSLECRESDSDMLDSTTPTTITTTTASDNTTTNTTTTNTTLTNPTISPIPIIPPTAPAPTATIGWRINLITVKSSIVSAAEILRPFATGGITWRTCGVTSAWVSVKKAATILPFIYS